MNFENLKIEEHYSFIGTSGNMTKEQHEKYLEKQKIEQEKKYFPQIKKPEQIKRCPLINGVHKTCLEKCAFYDQDEKRCLMQSKTATIKTVGKICPLSFGRSRETCSSYCAMYKDECCLLLSDIRKEVNEN